MALKSEKVVNEFYMLSVTRVRTVETTTEEWVVVEETGQGADRVVKRGHVEVNGLVNREAETVFQQRLEVLDLPVLVNAINP